MRRRDFLMTAAGVAAAASVPRRAHAQATATSRQAKLDRISIMSLNFQNILKVPDVQDSPARTLDLFELPTMLADTYGVHRVEYQHYHLASTEPLYLREIKRSLEKAGSRLTQVNVEFGDTMTFSVASSRYRNMTVDLTRQWIDHVAFMGGQRVMVNQGNLTPENRAVSIETLARMADYGRSKGIVVSTETRGPSGGGGRQGGARQGGPGGAPAAAPAAPPAPQSGRDAWMLLADVTRSADAYSNVDVGGARALNQQELHDCLKAMRPFTAGQMHTRVGTAWDLATAIRYLENDLDWHGLYTIETNGHEGTKAVYDVVLATL